MNNIDYCLKRNNPILKLYDSLSQEIKELNVAKELKIYLCGPTVYDDIHIGNLAPVIIFDFLIRYLKEKKIKFIYIHNITDIDDKIINKSKETGKTEEEISKEYTSRYLTILKDMNILMPSHMPKVSEHISEMHDVIDRLITSNHAEIKENGVIFKMNLIPEYGELSKQNIENLIDNSDFFLWKKMNDGRRWNSPWGEGRPGWHTECFTFIEKYASGTVDIHGGGIDLKFPHHENENAHCRALHKKNLSNIWMHIGHLKTNGEKISKSSNKKFLVKDLLKTYSPNTLRYIFLANKYTLPSLVSKEKLDQYHKDLESFYLSINKAKAFLYLNNHSELSKNLIDEKFINLIEEDLDLPNLLTWLQKLKKELNQEVKSKNIQEIQNKCSKLIFHLEWLGFKLNYEDYERNKDLLDEWKKNMEIKNYDRADSIRKILINKKIF